eukprot:7466605-Alexandrium_andersonii.AAC.1
MTCPFCAIVCAGRGCGDDYLPELPRGAPCTFNSHSNGGTAMVMMVVTKVMRNVLVIVVVARVMPICWR